MNPPTPPPGPRLDAPNVIESGDGGSLYEEPGGRITSIEEILSPFTRQNPLVLLLEFLAEHQQHRWEEVGPCVWCVDCNVRLYQGALPDDKAPANRVTCQHENQDWDSGLGFYGVCTDCGQRMWAED